MSYSPNNPKYLTVSTSMTNDGEKNVKIILDIETNIFYTLDDDGNFEPIQFNEWTETEVTVTEAQLLTLGTSPITLLPAPGVNNYYEYEITLERINGTVRLDVTDAFLIGGLTSYNVNLISPTTFFLTPGDYVQVSSRATTSYQSNTEVVSLSGQKNEAVSFCTYNQVNPISVSAGAEFKFKIKYKIITFG